MSLGYADSSNGPLLSAPFQPGALVMGMISFQKDTSSCGFHPPMSRDNFCSTSVTSSHPHTHAHGWPPCFLGYVVVAEKQWSNLASPLSLRLSLVWQGDSWVLARRPASDCSLHALTLIQVPFVTSPGLLGPAVTGLLDSILVCRN